MVQEPGLVVWNCGSGTRVSGPGPGFNGPGTRDSAQVPGLVVQDQALVVLEPGLSGPGPLKLIIT